MLPKLPAGGYGTHAPMHMVLVSMLSSRHTTRWDSGEVDQGPMVPFEGVLYDSRT